MAKPTVWYILSKKEHTGELGNTKRPKRPWKTTAVDDRRILSMIKKNPFTTSNQAKNTLQEVDISLSKSTIKGRLQKSKYRRFTTRCKPLISLKNRKTRFGQFWNSIIWTDETMIDQPVPESWEEQSMKKAWNGS